MSHNFIIKKINKQTNKQTNKGKEHTEYGRKEKKHKHGIV